MARGHDAPRRHEVLGLPVHVLDRSGLLEAVDDMIASGGRHTIAYANIHTWNTALERPELAEFLRLADVVYCDGEGVRLAARAQGVRLPERMTGADWIWDLAEHAASRGYQVFWIGGREGVAAEAGLRLRQAHPGLTVVGTHHGYFEHGGADSDALVAAVNRAAPDIVLVGMGTPLQEQWVARVRDGLQAPVVWVLGATADFVSGRVTRGPEVLHRHGLEWLARLLVEPRRLWRRYLVGNARFAARVLRERQPPPGGRSG